ncbi:hypothetical protein ACOI92_08060 [Corynebacterium striatum]
MIHFGNDYNQTAHPTVLDARRRARDGLYLATRRIRHGVVVQ